MGTNKSQNRLSEYRRIMMQREGLSFSDYMDDSVPADVKPSYSLTPMEESDFVGHSDIPTQSKDLFKGLWEGYDNNVLKNGDMYWMDINSKFWNTKKVGNSHAVWAVYYLLKQNVEDYGDEPVLRLFDLGFIRIKVVDDEIQIEHSTKTQPSHYQLRALKTAAQNSDMSLIDTTGYGRRNIEIYESKYVNKDGRSLFIESIMMPDNMDAFKSHLVQLFAYLQKELQLKTVPSVKLISDEKNADKVLGKTAYYNPDEKLVVLYTTNRHQKDILRSFAHEIIHHWQHENEKLHEGDDKKGGTGDPQYAQNNPWLRQMEKQAYLLGNILFRDWEDKKKSKDKKSGFDDKVKKKKTLEKTNLIGKEYPPNNHY